MRHIPSLSFAALSLLRFLVVVSFLFGATPWSAAASTARFGDSGPRNASFGLSENITVPGTSVPQPDRTIRKDIPTDIQLLAALTFAAQATPAQDADFGGAAIGASWRHVLTLLRPEPRAPPLSI